MQYEEVVGLLVAARKVKVEIDSKIKRLEREVLETKIANGRCSADTQSGR